MAPRSWLIVLDLGETGETTVQATVDDCALLPRKTYRQPLDALEYVDQVLVDFHAGDGITLVALNAPTPLTAWSTRIRSVAIQWCAIVLARDSYLEQPEPPRSTRDES